jgi:glycosyltransferase involved in cell wall biosynthesis
MNVATPRPSVVLMITGAYFPELSGGGLQCKATIDALRSDQPFTVLTTSTDASLPEVGEVDGTPVFRVHVDVRSRWSKIRAAWRFARVFLTQAPAVDIIHLHGFSQKSTLAIVLAKLLGKRVVLTLHTAGHDEPADVRARGRLAYWAYSRVDLFIAVSEPLAASVERAGITASRVWRGSNGLDTERFRPVADGEQPALRRQLGLPDAGPIILFVGFFSRDKGPQVAFDAWRSIARDAGSASSLVYVGATHSQYYEVDPTLARSIRETAERDGLIGRIVFVEETRIIEQYYRAADMFVFPSRREAFGMALVEAMASGLPCIASRIPGVTDTIVDDGRSGVLVEPHDAAALAAAMERTLCDRAFAAGLGAAARRAVESRFSIRQTAQRTRDAYRFVRLDHSAEAWA